MYKYHVHIFDPPMRIRLASITKSSSRFASRRVLARRQRGSQFLLSFVVRHTLLAISLIVGSSSTSPLQSPQVFPRTSMNSQSAQCVSTTRTHIRPDTPSATASDTTKRRQYRAIARPGADGMDLEARTTPQDTILGRLIAAT